MPVDHIRYDLLTQDALRSVIRVVLADVAAKGLPGDHHFYITFDTRAEGVVVPPRLKARFPEEMGIVLQHQFRDLAVGEDGFGVGLDFNGVAERLHIPFRAIKVFADPSVQFQLHFTVAHGDAAPPAESAQAAADAPPASRPAEAGGAEVVSLDRFRKK